MRGAFLNAVEPVTPLLGSPTLAARWEEPSALERFRVSGLAGHLLWATTSVEAYLDHHPSEALRVL